MPDFFTTRTLQAGAGILVLCVLIAASFYLLSIFRDYAAQDQEQVDGALSKLEEMHLKGDISDEEFRTIQATTHRGSDRSDVDDASSPGDVPSKT